MPKLVFDIETIGEDYDSLDKDTQGALTKWIKGQSKNDDEYQNELKKLKDETGLSPLTGSIVCIGVLDVEKDKGAVYFQAPDSDIKETEENGIKFKPMTEKEMLENFWQGVTKYDQVVTFNGRSFDAPFLMLRSAIHGIKPSKNLMPYRYATDTNHLDLYDQMSFYGSSRKKGGLHLYCRAFNIESPKKDGMSGDNVTKMFKEKKYKEIAEYNADDIKATKELYLYWEKYLKF
ncbi:MAG: ribonuclease H-like domain-containing protein [Parcubacteria group bacterium]